MEYLIISKLMLTALVALLRDHTQSSIGASRGKRHLLISGVII